MTSPADRLTSAEAAELLGLSRSRLTDIIKACGWIPEPGPRNCKLWLREDVERERLRRIDKPPRPTWRKAADARKVDPKPAKVERKCLRCSESFMSSGAGNRLCDDCRDFAKRVSPVDAAITHTVGE